VAETGQTSGTLLAGVAGRYASALFELAQEAGQVDEIGRDLDRFDAMVGESPDLARLLRNPVFTADEQARAVGAVLDHSGIGGLAGNFIRLVAANRRLFALPQMIRAYRELVANAKGIVRAEVTLAASPSDAVMNDIRAALKDLAKSEVAMDVKIDPSLIGGLIVKMGSRMVDASVRTKLNSIRHSLREVR
jgi:F-type H+-transporting ATPase subunit delta